jgi:hypothetical protein
MKPKRSKRTTPVASSPGATVDADGPAVI